MIYAAVVTREGDQWLAEVRGLAGAHAYARTLTRLRAELANAIILSADLDDDVNVEISFRLQAGGNPMVARAFAVAERRRQLHRDEAEVVAETAALAKSLIEEGWSVRDAAGALDVTAGRISQLVNG